MKMNVMLGIIALVLVQVWCHSALGLVPAISLDENEITVLNSLGGYAMGWEFTLTDDVTVTHLGVYDDWFFLWENYPSGFYTSHYIGIYRASDDALVASAMLSGTPSTFVGPYRYVGLTEFVKLDVGVNYVVACWTAPSSLDFHVRGINLDPVPANSPVKPGQCFAEWSGDGGLVMPKTGAVDALFTANFIIATEVTIDIKPGSYPNCINLRSSGVVPVAILSSTTLDATTVDPNTVYLAGAGVAVRGKADKYLSHSEDVNGDGQVDLVVQVVTENLNPDTFQDGHAQLTAETYSGEGLVGLDEITIVPLQ